MAPHQAVIYTIVVSLKALVLNWAWSGCGTEGYPSGQCPLVTVLSTWDVRNLLADGKTVSWVVSRRDLRLWLGEAFSVVLVVYDGRRDRALWLHVQANFADNPAADLFLAGETMNVHIPVTNRLNRRAVQRIIQRKNATQAHLQARRHSDV
jgi:hypothetical protein